MSQPQQLRVCDADSSQWWIPPAAGCGIGAGAGILVYVVGGLVFSIVDAAQGLLPLFAAAVGVAVGAYVCVRSFRESRQSGEIVCDADGVTRIVGEFRATAPWPDVEHIAVVRHNRVAGDMLVCRVRPPLRLTPPGRRARHRARMNIVQYGGAAVAPLRGVAMSVEEMDTVVAACSGGACRVERRSSPDRRRST